VIVYAALLAALAIGSSTPEWQVSSLVPGDKYLIEIRGTEVVGEDGMLRLPGLGGPGMYSISWYILPKRRPPPVYDTGDGLRFGRE